MACLVLLSATLSARGEEPASKAPPSTPEKAATPATPPVAAGGEAKAPATPAPSSRPAVASPQRFDPSEKVRADYPVAFPIDI